jgi:hypothetical protein
MNKKIKLIIFFLSFFYFGLTFAGSWMDPNGNYMDSTDKNDPNYNEMESFVVCPVLGKLRFQILILMMAN